MAARQHVLFIRASHWFSDFLSFQAEPVPEGENQRPVVGQEPEQNRLGGWSIVKTLIVRTVIIYAISSFFRRSTSPAPDTTGAPGAVSVPGVGPSSNIYLKNQELVSGKMLKTISPFSFFCHLAS